MFEQADIPQPMSRAEYRKTESGRAERARYRKSPGGRAAKAKYRAEYRGSDKQREHKKTYEEQEWLRRPFIAWDGEGVTREDGRHDYLLLANSEGTELRSLDKLGTVEIFEYVLSHYVKGSKDINVIYGAGYDWNMWLSDLPRETLEELYKRGDCEWSGYRISWRRGKTFRVADAERSMNFFDVISFFQCAFVKACDDYLGADFVHRDMIVENKMLRSGFRPDDLDVIATYCRAELVNLVNLMNELRIRLFRAGLKPGRWDGPGAIAVALMRREGVKEHLEQAPDEVMPAIRSAYFGGRFEVVKCGSVTRAAYEYDINSAYPWALQDLPSLAGGQWRYVAGDPGPQSFAVYNIEYTASTGTTFPQPLPCRYENGAVAYPLAVTGWYWTPEYLAVNEYISLYGGTVIIHGAWVFEPRTNNKPFDFVEPLFNKRRALKKAKDGAHVGIKLGLNSMYGKLAQQVGWRKARNGEIIIPPYHQLDWAGYITSKCRAAVLTAALPQLGSVIAWETDAMFTEVPLDVKCGSGLGEWDYLEFTELTYLQSGTYFGIDVDGNTINKTRGVDRGTLTREIVLDTLRAGESTVPATLTRFTGIGIALAQDFKKWRRWITAPKNVQLVPNGKRAHVPCSVCVNGGFRLGEWHSTILGTWARPSVSCEYQIEWQNPGNMSKDLSELRQGHYESGRYDD